MSEIIKVAKRVNCHDRVGSDCVKNHPLLGPTPDPAACALCPHRRAIDDGPAVDWIDGVAVCLGHRNRYTADAWLTLLSARLRLVGTQIVVPVALLATAERVDAD